MSSSNKTTKIHSDESTEKSFGILWGLLIGLVIGAGLNYLGPSGWQEALLANIIQPVGSVFLQSLFLVVVPLVFASLIVGVTNLGGVEHLGKLGGRLFTFYMVTTLCAVIIGQLIVTTVRPGDGLDQAQVQSVVASMETQIEGLREKSSKVNQSLWPGIVSTIIPRNLFDALANANMLGIIFVSIIIGLALMRLENKEWVASVTNPMNAITEVCILAVGWIMKFAPIAVGALMISAVSRFGIEIMGQVLWYMLVVVAGYLTQVLIVYPLLVRLVIKYPTKEFFKRMTPIFVTAFSTSSSSATMPTTIRTLEVKFGVPGRIANFSVPLGMTVNMDGTALFEVVAALFIAQVFGVDISLAGQVSLVVLVLLTSIGVAGVPGGSIPILMSAMATLGIPAEGIALILGVDRLLDMGRTVVNVTGDSVAALYLARVEKTKFLGE